VTDPVVAAAVADLARRRGVDAARIAVAGAEPLDWPDAGLGCPEPGRSYAQVITPGWRIQLTLDGQTITYHANRSGTVLTPCPRGSV
jgi:hypothetical protein